MVANVDLNRQLFFPPTLDLIPHSDGWTISSPPTCAIADNSTALKFFVRRQTCTSGRIANNQTFVMMFYSPSKRSSPSVLLFTSNHLPYKSVKRLIFCVIVLIFNTLDFSSSPVCALWPSVAWSAELFVVVNQSMGSLSQRNTSRACFHRPYTRRLSFKWHEGTVPRVAIAATLSSSSQSVRYKVYQG